MLGTVRYRGYRNVLTGAWHGRTDGFAVQGNVKNVNSELDIDTEPEFFIELKFVDDEFVHECRLERRCRSVLG